jgi:hypothetical protein
MQQRHSAPEAGKSGSGYTLAMDCSYSSIVMMSVLVRRLLSAVFVLHHITSLSLVCCRALVFFLATGSDGVILAYFRFSPFPQDEDDDGCHYGESSS